MPWPDVDNQPQHVRYTLTRLLCFSIYGGWLVLLLMALSLLFVREINGGSSVDWFAALLPHGLALYAWWFVGRLILRVWRRCDRCREPLFAEGKLIGKKAPHFEARILAGSYTNATAWAYMRHGSARCMWCGHRDGETPEFTMIR